MENLRFGPIVKKMADIEVSAQCKPGDDCLSDCKREVWKGNSSSSTKGCNTTTITDSHWSVCR